jgi:uncharacterized protein YdbL (DUF1318 family)
MPEGGNNRRQKGMGEQVRRLLGRRAVRFLLPLLLVLAPAARAMDLDADNATVADAKARGIIGEQEDGMLGVVRGDPDAGIMGAVAELNEMRAASYREAAARAGTTWQQEGEKAGRTHIEAVPAGEFYKPPGGAWTRK